MLSFVIMKILTSIYVSIFPDIKISQPVGRVVDWGFSIYVVYGIIYSSVVFTVQFILMLINIQRLRDMGYRHPVVVSLLLIILTQVSNFIDDSVIINFISLFIDIGLWFFTLIMLFTKSKIQV